MGVGAEFVRGQHRSGRFGVLANLVFLCKVPITSGTSILRMWKAFVYDPGTFSIICKELIQSNEGKNGQKQRPITKNKKETQEANNRRKKYSTPL